MISSNDLHQGCETPPKYTPAEGSAGMCVCQLSRALVYCGFIERSDEDISQTAAPRVVWILWGSGLRCTSTVSVGKVEKNW